MNGPSKFDALRTRLAALGRDIEASFVTRAKALRDAAARLDETQDGVRAEARDEIRRLAHKLRGVAGSAGHPHITQQAGELEEATAGPAANRTIADGARQLAATMEELHARPSAKRQVPVETPPCGFQLGWRVIAVDDDPTARRLLAILLTHTGGCDAFVTAEPTEAMALALERPPDVLIVDAVMPDIDGLSFYRQIRSRLGANVPVVIMSAASADDLGWALPRDPRLCWMHKPFRPGAFLADLRAFVEG